VKFHTFQELTVLWNLTERQVRRIVNLGEYQGKKLTIKEEKFAGSVRPRRLVLWDSSPISKPKPLIRDGFFIDKLNVKQVHEGDLRLVGKQGIYYVDLQTGETSESPYITHLQHEGSYSTSLMIRCDGSKIEVYGNPSRFGRIDNLFGYRTLDECFAFYNSILEKFGLPPFTKCTEYLYFQGKEGSKVNKTANGALISHIDFTRNLSVGRDNERAFLKALSTQSIGKSVKPYLYADENTVDWYSSNMQKNGSTFRYIKVYNKYQDLLRHQAKILKRADSSDFAYYGRLLDFCQENGVVREEHSFKRPLLKKLNCFAWGLFSESQLDSELQHITELRKRLSVVKTDYSTIADELLNRGICKSRQSAHATMSYYILWLHGQPLETHKTQFRVHKSRLLQLGIDIGINYDVSRSSVLYAKSSKLIEATILTPPDWYKLPQ